MSKRDSSSHALEQTGSLLVEQIYSGVVGVDTDGYRHHYWKGADTVVVYDTDDVDHVEYLDGRLLTEWVEYVTEKRGWDHPGTWASVLLKADFNKKRNKPNQSGSR